MVESTAEKTAEKKIDTKNWAGASAKAKEAAKLRKQRDAVLKAAVAANGPEALKNILPLSLSFELVEGTDVNDESIFLTPCVKITPIVNPLMDAVLQKLGATPRGRRTYSMSIGEKASGKSLIAALQALPGNVLYTKDELEERIKKGGHSHPSNSHYHIRYRLAQTPCGQNVASQLAQAVGGYSYGPSYTASTHSAIQVVVNDKEIFIKFTTFPQAGTKGLFLFEGAPNLHLLRPEGTHEPIRVSADEAVALYGAAQAFGYELPAIDWLDTVRAKMRGAVIAQGVSGSPGEARLIVGADVQLPEEVEDNFQPLYTGCEDAVSALRSVKEIGDLVAKLPSTPVFYHEQVADVIRMETAPLINYPGLRPYQNEVVRRHLATSIGFLNVSATGLGKTVMTLTAYRAKAQAKALVSDEPYLGMVVMQKTLLAQWAGETKRHFKDAEIVTIASAAPTKLAKSVAEIETAVAENKPVVVLTSYETVKGCHEDLAKFTWDDLAVDESVVLVSTSAARSQALWSLRKSAKVALGLTGTPIERSLDDLGRMLAWARNDEAMFYGKRLSQRFNVAYEGDMNRMWRAIGPTVVRYDRSELKDVLPQIATDVVPLKPHKTEDDLANGARRKLREIYLKMVEKIEKMMALSPNDPALAEARSELQSARGAVLGGVTLARIAASDPVAVAASDSIGATLLESEGLIEPATKHGTKRAWTTKVVKAHVKKGDAVIIFTDFASVADNLREQLDDAGLAVGIFKGGMNETVRVETKDRFQGVPCPHHEAELAAGAVEGCADCVQPDLDVLVLTKAACKGLNLQRASVLVHYDLPWLPSDIIQRVGRASRYGTTNTHLKVYIPIMKGTIEERVAALLVPRAIVAMQALDGHRGVDARETEIGMSMKGLAENVSTEEQGENVSIFDLAKELLADDKKELAKAA